MATERQYWVRNEQGRTWGPYDLEALERLRGIFSEKWMVALDGRAFKPASDFPELSELAAAPRRGPPPPIPAKPTRPRKTSSRCARRPARPPAPPRSRRASPREPGPPSGTGAQGSASVGVGVGGNVLVGGSDNSIALQPLSVQGQVGVNVAAGLESLELRPG